MKIKQYKKFNPVIQYRKIRPKDRPYVAEKHN